ncbi:hypothetical protein [Calothrix sp. CCY 0018]|uniref:hypothetical protein n=1 Tax=Calothrix sp. CCY 0018 TaxID=3103864 RepID=UPI0039C6CBEB
MISNNSQEISSENYIGVPATTDIPTPPIIQPTPYHYLALLPAILTALTPLILGMMKKDEDDKDKE